MALETRDCKPSHPRPILFNSRGNLRYVEATRSNNKGVCQGRDKLPCFIPLAYTRRKKKQRVVFWIGIRSVGALDTRISVDLNPCKEML